MADPTLIVNGIVIAYNGDTATSSMSSSAMQGVTSEDEYTFLDKPYNDWARVLANGKAARTHILK